MVVLAALPLLAHTDNWNHHWWPIWPFLWAALIGFAVWLIVRQRNRRPDSLDRAREVLAERYARGDITGEEYRARVDDLRRDTP